MHTVDPPLKEDPSPIQKFEVSNSWTDGERIASLFSISYAFKKKLPFQNSDTDIGWKLVASSIICPWTQSFIVFKIMWKIMALFS